MAWFKKKNDGKIVKNKKVKLGFAFGGGALRGLGYIGVFKAFEELGIKPDYIAGTSVGSIFGALLAGGFTSDQVLEEMKTLKFRDIKNSRFIWKPSNAENIEEVLKKVFKKDIMFSELQIPLSIVAVNIRNGKEVIITSGSVAKASSGSCALPGIFTPVVYGDMHLMDGGLKNVVPADVVREMGANVVIAFDVNRTRGIGTDSLKMLDVLKGSLGIIMQANVEKKLEDADLILMPNLDRFSASKLGDIDAMIKAGYDVVMNNKEEIIRLISSRPKLKIYKLARKYRNARLKINAKGKTEDEKPVQ